MFEATAEILPDLGEGYHIDFARPGMVWSDQAMSIPMLFLMCVLYLYYYYLLCDSMHDVVVVTIDHVAAIDHGLRRRRRAS